MIFHVEKSSTIVLFKRILINNGEYILTVMFFYRKWTTSILFSYRKAINDGLFWKNTHPKWTKPHQRWSFIIQKSSMLLFSYWKDINDNFFVVVNSSTIVFSYSNFINNGLSKNITQQQWIKPINGDILLQKSNQRWPCFIQRTSTMIFFLQKTHNP